MSNILIGGIVLALTWAAYEKYREMEALKNASEAVKKEENQGRVEYAFKARYQGGYTRFPSAANITVVGANSKIHFRNLTNQSRVSFCILPESIVDFGVGAPNVPYIMNLNAAGILANALTRKQVGTSAYIVFTDDIGMNQTVHLEQLKGMSAEDFIQQVHQAVARVRRNQAALQGAGGEKAEAV